MIEPSNSKHTNDKEFIAAVLGFLSERHKFFREFFKKQLAIAGYTQTRLATVLSVDNSTVSNWLSGKRMPEPQMIYDCCKALMLNKKRQKMFIVAYFSAKLAVDLLELIKRSLDQDDVAGARNLAHDFLGRYFDNLDSED